MLQKEEIFYLKKKNHCVSQVDYLSEHINFLSSTFITFTDSNALNCTIAALAI